MPCLDDTTIAALAANRLSATARALAMAHVGQCPSCDERLQEALFGHDAATADINAPGTAAPVVEDVTELAGTRLGRYLIIDQVGRGALGIVYSAYDPELDRRIAIKVLRQTTTSEQQQESLRREARSMARLSHPNVVPVFDVGIADRRLFIAMELVDGWTLGDWVRSEERSWREIRDVYCLAGQGLIAAHRAGLVYRDFKPSNVMLGRDGQVRVLDFGIAHTMLGPATLVPGGVSGPRGGIGTPGYMAPEQYSSAEKVDARADQFAFCASLYEALYGVRPFGGRSPELVRDNTLAQVWAEPQRDPGAPPWLHAAIVRGLEVDRASRWPDMASLLNALVKDRRSRRVQLVALASAMLGTALVTSAITLFVSGELDPADRDRIEQLTIDTRAAAARSHYVYPPADEPEAPTAYGLVLELEGLEGDAAEPAHERAQELRTELGDTLVQLGDRYYEDEGARPFAIDYYAEALMFVDDEHARSRLVLTPGELASLRERAQNQSFSNAELVAAEPLAILAEPDEAVRKAKLVAIRERLGPGALGAREHMSKLLGEAPPPDRGAAVDGVATPPVEPPAEPVVADSAGTPDSAVVAEPVPTSRPSRPTADGAGGSTPRDPVKAAAVAKQARAAFASNRLEQAETLYHQALELDSRNEAALAGLSELYFERGKYRQSLDLAKKAVARAPEQGKLRILLGDAHFKVLEYADARRNYEKALALGHPSAAKRLEKLEKTVGN